MKQQCQKCAAYDDCRWAFGVFWRKKSSDGKGCDEPLAGWPKGWKDRLKKTMPQEKVTKQKTVRSSKLPWQGEI